MALTTAERQQAYRLKHKHDLKRIDLLIKPEDAGIFKAQVKESGMTRAEYFKEMLSKEACYTDNLKIECTDEELNELKAKHQLELEELRVGYDAEIEQLDSHLSAVKKLRNNEQLQKDCSRAERALDKANARIEKLDAENDNLSIKLHKLIGDQRTKTNKK